MRLRPLALLALAPLAACAPAYVTEPPTVTEPPIEPAPSVAQVLKIRGPTSATMSRPLIVIDGQVVSMSLNTLDVESVEIIRAASAAALYGNYKCPPIIIRTKRRTTATPAEH